jgi:SAM-dependent methyltransferase
MFFPDRIKSIKETDKVLEIGPGATPYFRSDVFLELQYDNDKERIAQSGHVGILETPKPIVYYDGGKFPFEDKEFDDVICSHVLEHVADADVFLREIQRVGKQGYLEFPTVYYDYIYNFPEHQLFLLQKEDVIN